MGKAMEQKLHFKLAHATTHQVCRGNQRVPHLECGQRSKTNIIAFGKYTMIIWQTFGLTLGIKFSHWKPSLIYRTDMMLSPSLCTANSNISGNGLDMRTSEFGWLTMPGTCYSNLYTPKEYGRNCSNVVSGVE